MKYMCLVYHPEQGILDMPDSELEEIVRKCGAWLEDLDQGGHHVLSARLQGVASATTLRNDGGRITTTDGPFAETKEVLAGFTIIEARDLAEALQLASKFPLVLGSIEVRPLFKAGSEQIEPIDQKVAAAVEGAATV